MEIKLNENLSFSQYGKSFQDRLSFLILEDRIFSDRMSEVLKVEFLESKYLQWFVDKIFEYKKQFKVHPSRDTMDTLIRSTLSAENELLQKQVVEYYTRMITTTIDNADYIKKESIDFCRKQKLHEGMLKSVPLLKTNSFEAIRKIINDSLKAGEEIDSGHDYLADFEKRYVENVREPITTGFPEIDKITNGGIGRGEYSILLAATGAGKTMMLVSMAAAALKDGKNVVFYTLELRSEVIGLRFDACLSGIPIDELKDKKDEILLKIKGVSGKLIIKHYPKKSASLATIKLHQDRLRSQGFITDEIVVDYLDLLKPISVKKELRMEIGETNDEFEALCQENNIAGITASQVNRTGASSNLVLMEHTSEAFNRHFGSYLTLSLTRNNIDKQNNTGKIAVLKNRNGYDGMAYNIFMDPAIVDIKIIGEYDPDKDSSSQIDPEEEKRRLKEKYKKFKQNYGA